MKPHLVVKLRAESRQPDLPHWAAIIVDPSLSTDRFHPQVDAILARHHLPVLATREFAPGSTHWSHAEIESGLDRIYRLILLEQTRIPRSLIEEISLLPMIEEVRIGQVGAVELPPLQASAFSAIADQASRDSIYLPEAHRYSEGDPEIIVAVLDTGVDLAHIETRDAMLPGMDFVNIIDGAAEFIGDVIDADSDPTDEFVGHGAHVSGIIAGRGARMPKGVVPRCRLLPVRVLAAMGREGRAVGAGLIDNINAGVKWAVDQGAEVINMSLGVRHEGGGLPHQEVIDYAARRGVTVVAAAGNDGGENLYYPGGFPSVIAVGALDESGEIAPYSTWGRQVSFVAPGTNVYSCTLRGEYAFATGTSHAAPFVTGACALLKCYARAKGRDLSDRNVKHILKHTADKADLRFKHRKTGYGKVNLADALRLLDYKLN